jgi:hypothetical protein
MTKKTTQKTLKERFEIPIPKRGDVFDMLKKAAKPQKESGTSSPKKKGLK